MALRIGSIILGDVDVSGHLEGDLAVGAHAGSLAGTLVEGRSRHLLLDLPDGSGTDSVTAALSAAVDELPPALRRSVTWDRGIEMTRIGSSEIVIASGG